MINTLCQLNLDFITQYNTDWCGNKRYDFYIPSLNMIIETHGIQHYNDKRNWGKNNFNDIQKNDEEKRTLALTNGIEKYVIIDCRESTLDWLKNNVLKELSNIFDISFLDWNYIWKKCQSSLCVQTWEMWNAGMNRKSISNKLKIHPNTVSRYLKKGKECKICDYTDAEMRERGRR